MKITLTSRRKCEAGRPSKKKQLLARMKAYQQVEIMQPTASVMTQPLNSTKLKAAAEHLEWVLKQYPESEDVRSLLSSLMPLVEDAKAGRALGPVEKIPGAYNFADGLYVPFKNSSVGDAYARFATEMEGDLIDEDKEQIARLEAMLEARQREASS